MVIRMKEDIDTARAQMRKGMLEFCTLLIIEKDTAYVSDILKELKIADLIVVEGTLYPLLSRLKSEGLLEYSWQESKSGPPRKYYSLTDAGKKTLAQLKTVWKTLTTSINSLITDID
ncbi:MAG TPA: PadR family transcriptional regulator [Candidatus Paceibacterota bacterium]